MQGPSSRCSTHPQDSTAAPAYSAIPPGPPFPASVVSISSRRVPAEVFANPGLFCLKFRGLNFFQESGPAPSSNTVRSPRVFAQAESHLEPSKCLK